jgi:hypothetical protein
MLTSAEYCDANSCKRVFSAARVWLSPRSRAFSFSSDGSAVTAPTPPRAASMTTALAVSANDASVVAAAVIGLVEPARSALI